MHAIFHITQRVSKGQRPPMDPPSPHNIFIGGLSMFTKRSIHLFLALLFSFVLLVSFPACKTSNDDDEPNTNSVLPSKLTGDIPASLGKTSASPSVILKTRALRPRLISSEYYFSELNQNVSMLKMQGSSLTMEAAMDDALISQQKLKPRAEPYTGLKFTVTDAIKKRIKAMLEECGMGDEYADLGLDQMTVVDVPDITYNTVTDPVYNYLVSFNTEEGDSSVFYWSTDRKKAKSAYKGTYEGTLIKQAFSYDDSTGTSVMALYNKNESFEFTYYVKMVADTENKAKSGVFLTFYTADSSFRSYGYADDNGGAMLIKDTSSGTVVAQGSFNTSGTATEGLDSGNAYYAKTSGAEAKVSGIADIALPE